MIEAERDLEYFKAKHKRLSRAVDELEKERQHDRSPELKVNLSELKKQKLRVKDQINLMEKDS